MITLPEFRVYRVVEFRSDDPGKEKAPRLLRTPHREYYGANMARVGLADKKNLKRSPGPPCLERRDQNTAGHLNYGGRKWRAWRR